MQIGDKVTVIKSVWDDHNNCDWWESTGFIESESDDPFTGKRGWYVKFPDTKEKINSFDFYEEELELIK